MAPKPPSKNRINMHDIIGQPLGTLPDAVAAILHRPEALDEVEVRGIFAEASYLLLRAEEALSARDDVALCALFKLLSEGLARGDASPADGVQVFSRSPSLMQGLHHVFQATVGRGGYDPHSAAAVEVVQVVGCLCDTPALKERCGELFLIGLAGYLGRIYADPTIAMRHVHAQRVTATALINLVKGSKQNKVRLPSWRVVADSCATSVDVFFQLQCIELLFRVARQNKSLLDGLANPMRRDVLEQIRRLPNDAGLLQRMLELLGDLNQDRADVLAFPLSRVDAGDAVVSEATMAYFTPYYLVVMVMVANADNITIPFRSIRSVTLGKDGRVMMRLDEFPVKLESFLKRGGGIQQESVTLRMDARQLVAFKQSAIHCWIVSELAAKKEALRVAQAKGPLVAQAAEAVTASDDGIPRPEKRPKTETSEPVARDSAAAGGVAPLSSTAARGGAQINAEPTTHDVVRRMLHDAHGNVGPMLEQLQQMISSSDDVGQEEVVAVLNDALSAVQQLVDDRRASMLKYRTESQAVLWEAVQQIDDKVATTETHVGQAVQRLNDMLLNVKTANVALNEQMVCLDVQVQQILETCRQSEVSEVRELRARLDRELSDTEAEWSRTLMERSNPRSILAEFISSRLQEQLPQPQVPSQ